MAFTLPNLPFGYDALAPHMSANTLKFHHDKHHKAYVDKLNKAGTPVHCVVYEHGQGSFQKAYDTKGKNTLAKMSGAEATFSMWPPKPGVPKGEGTNRRGSTTTGTTRSEARKKALSRQRKGAIARAERSGIMLRVAS